MCRRREHGLLKRLRRDPWFRLGGSLFLLLALAAAFGPPLAPHDPFAMDSAPFARPSAAHLLGVNDCGQDIFSELLHAVRNTVVFGVAIVIVLIAAFLIMRIKNVK